MSDKLFSGGVFSGGVFSGRRIGGAALVLALALQGAVAPGADRAKAPAGSIDFAADVQPILAKRCFKCHGGVKRESGLSLKFFETATADADSGAPAIVPGRPDESELIRRVSSEDADERMPAAGDRLSDGEVETLRRWVSEGAKYQPHWSFVGPVRHERPPVADGAWPRGGIDRFVLARLEAEGLRPSPEANREILIRRVSLDLIGLPPTPGEVAAFVDDTSAGAYEKLVDRLLASPRFGERWARPWLDLARYADTKGYEKDPRRTIWRYRDWVVEAMNNDMPFDQFTIEQLAGDLLPDPTLEQWIATAFHRNTMTNTEGGTDDEEYRTLAVMDRVSTTWQAWGGMTFACTQCHDHPYEPFSNREYYEFFAFFNQTEDSDKADERPTMVTPTRDQLGPHQQLTREIAAIREKLDVPSAELAAAQQRWEKAIIDKLDDLAAPRLGDWHALGPFQAGSASEAYATRYGPEDADRVDLARSYQEGALAWEAHPDWADGKVQVVLKGDNAATYLFRTITCDFPQPLRLSLGSDDTITLWVNGSQVLDKEVYHLARHDQERITISLRAGENQLLMKIANLGGDYGFYFKARETKVPNRVVEILKTAAEDRTEQQQLALAKYYGTFAPETAGLRAQIATLGERLKAIGAPVTPVMRDLPSGKERTTRQFVRGSFLNPGDEVTAGVPRSMHAWPEGAPRNRLGLARWLVDRDNPLTGRVTVNRYWQHIFGIGLVETSEDFGSQGTRPSHPKLLDWLATRFVTEQQWSVKRLLKEIVMSATYRQSPASTPELTARDPDNRLLAHGPRFRMEAEMIRDQALSVSGLLSDKMYGPSVMPPQPAGLWQLVYSGDKWKNSTGDDRHRRGLYTFWRRTIPYPSMMAMDAVSREVCVVRRIRTNTPLAAFATLNDPVYVEAAQALARRLVLEGGSTPKARAAFGWRLALARGAEDREVARLVALYDEALDRYRADASAAVEMATDPLGPLPAGMAADELAAWTVVCNVLLNLDEFLVKQ